MKEYLVTMTIGDDIGGTSSYITVEDGKINTAAVEDEFFALLRKSQKSLIEAAEEDEKSDIIDHLTPAQEDKLKEAHGKDYIGCDDDMPDACEDWLMNLSLQELKDALK